MPFTRRQLLKFSGLSASASLLSYTPLSIALKSGEGSGIQQNLMLGGGRFKESKDGEFRQVLSIVDIDSGITMMVDLNFYPHGIHVHPDHPQRLALFEKKGPGACELDLFKREVIRYLETDKSRYFYGHGSYSTDGSLLYCTESYLDSFKGIIAIRDSKTMDYLGEFPTYGLEPHECKLIDDGKVMVVTNSGGVASGDKPSVTYIDVQSEKLIEKVELTNEQLGSGHFAIGEDGSLVVVSPARMGLEETNPGGVSIRPAGKEIESIAAPQELTSQLMGEALSVVIHEGYKIAAVTHPEANRVTFWSMEDRRLLSVMELPQPRGVSLTMDNRYFVISYDSRPKMMKVDAGVLQKAEAQIIDNTYLSGSHIYNWSRELREFRPLNPWT